MERTTGTAGAVVERGDGRRRMDGPSWRPWSADDERQLSDLWIAGRPRAEIAARLGRTEAAIQSRARRLRLPIRPPFGGRQPLWTEQELDQLREQWQAGIPMKDIAAALGRTRSAVNNTARYIGLPRRNRGRHPDIPDGPRSSPNGAAATDGLPALRREVERLWLLVAVARGCIDLRQAARALGLASPDDVGRAIERVAAVGRLLAEQRGQSQER
jgi:hypothetical protein